MTISFQAEQIYKDIHIGVFSRITATHIKYHIPQLPYDQSSDPKSHLAERIKNVSLEPVRIPVVDIYTYANMKHKINYRLNNVRVLFDLLNDIDSEVFFNKDMPISHEAYIERIIECLKAVDYSSLYNLDHLTEQDAQVNPASAIEDILKERIKRDIEKLVCKEKISKMTKKLKYAKEKRDITRKRINALENDGNYLNAKSRLVKAKENVHNIVWDGGLSRVDNEFLKTQLVLYKNNKIPERLGKEYLVFISHRKTGDEVEKLRLLCSVYLDYESLCIDKTNNDYNAPDIWNIRKPPSVDISNYLINEEAIHHYDMNPLFDTLCVFDEGFANLKFDIPFDNTLSEIDERKEIVKLFKGTIDSYPLLEIEDFNKYAEKKRCENNLEMYDRELRGLREHLGDLNADIDKYNEEIVVCGRRLDVLSGL